MKRPGTLLVAAVTLPFLTGCFAVLPAPIPTAPDRESMDVRGVIVRGDNGEDDRRVQFSEVLNVEWMDGGIVLIGMRGGRDVVTEEYRYENLSGVLARQLDVTKVSLGIAGVMLGALATLALVVNSSGDGGTTTIPVGQ